MMHRNGVCAAAVVWCASAGGCYVGAVEGPTEQAQWPGPQDINGESPANECAAEASAPDVLRRLTRSQYLNTVAELSGLPIPDTLTGLVPVDPMGSTGFSNEGQGLLVQQQHATAYQRIAEYVAKTRFTTPGAAQFAGCEVQEPSCLEAFVRRIVRRAYRRTPSDQEISDLLGLAQGLADPNDPWSAHAVVLETVLQSPHLLQVPEPGTPSELEGRQRLSGTVLATRLALWLWDRAPDDPLLDLATDGVLDTTDGLAATIEQMLADPRARDGVMAMATQWFEIDEVMTVALDSETFPAWTDPMRRSARGELEHLLVEHLAGPDANYRSLFDGTQSFVDANLGSLYGLDVDGLSEDFEPVWFDPAQQRGGLFGSAGFLAMGSSGTQASTVRRGAYVRRAVLCDEPPPPPPGVEMGDEDATTDHGSDPGCWACHAYLDPIGWGLERYDAMGGLREVGDDGQPFEDRGYVHAVSTTPFGNAPQLGTIVAESDRLALCAVKRLVEWATARPLDDAERCEAPTLRAVLENNEHSIPTLSRAIATSALFTHRTVP
ncbi:MAG: DUF1592 domain-containing protein [Deltaproteobacteria bacterium]|nr:DUF1592 domain-containing protein [Deltaproteobacteria bacterium]